ncbi:MAG: hypothetical protein ABI091_04870 [Ferruginibacter sp.]
MQVLQIGTAAIGTSCFSRFYCVSAAEVMTHVLFSQSFWRGHILSLPV